MTKLFKLSRDEDGQISYGLSIVDAKIFGGTLTAGTQASVQVGQYDRWAIFFPGLGQNYLVAPAMISPYGAGSFTQTTALQNVAHIDLDNWPQDGMGGKSLFVYAIDDLTMGMYIGQTSRVCQT